MLLSEEMHTASEILPIIGSVVIRIPHEFSPSAKETVRQLLVRISRGTELLIPARHTASTKSPAAAVYAEMTGGVMMRPIGSLRASGATSSGSNSSVKARRRFTRPSTGLSYFCLTRSGKVHILVKVSGAGATDCIDSNDTWSSAAGAWGSKSAMVVQDKPEN
jgi:hypothetical protein